MAVEIDETQLAGLQNTARIVQGLLRNPKTRTKVLEAYKEAHPDVPIPEIDANNQINTRMG